MSMRLAITGAAILLGSTIANADPATNWGPGYGHMGWGAGFGLLGGLMMLVFWGVIIALIVIAVRWLSGDGQGGGKSSEAMDILKSRFARGELDEEEFRKRKAVLED